MLFDTVASHASKVERFIIAGVILIVGTYGFALTAVVAVIINDETAAPVSLLGPVLLSGGIVLFRILWRSKTSPFGILPNKMSDAEVGKAAG